MLTLSFRVLLQAKHLRGEKVTSELGAVPFNELPPVAHGWLRTRVKQEFALPTCCSAGTPRLDREASGAGTSVENNHATIIRNQPSETREAPLGMVLDTKERRVRKGRMSAEFEGNEKPWQLFLEW